MKTYLRGIAAVFSALGALGAAQAETVGVVAVQDPPGPSAELVDLTLQLRAAAAERISGVLDQTQVRERMTGQNSGASLAELDRAYAGALATYQNGEFSGSVRTLRAVIDDLERLPDSRETFAQWTRAMLRLARSEQTLGHKAEAAKLIDRLVRADPYIKADPTQYPPSFGKQVQAAAEKFRKLPKRKLLVDSTPRGARIFVEGRETGVAPFTLELPKGSYRVSAQQADLRVPRVLVDVSDESQSVMLNFSVAASLRPSLGPGLALPEAERQRNVITAGALLGLDKLIAANLTTQSDVQILVGTLYDVRRGMLLREGRVRLSNQSAPPGSIAALAAFLLTGQASQLVAADGGTPPGVTAAQPGAADAAKAGAGAGAAGEATKAGAGSTVAAAAPPPAAASPAAPAAKPAKRTAAPRAASTPAVVAQPKGSSTLGWLAVGTGVITAGLGTFAVVEGLSAKSSYDSASGMQGPNKTLKAGSDPRQYNQLVADGDSSRSKFYIAAGAAAATLAVTGLLWWMSGKPGDAAAPAAVRF